jgi:hypothetical protein
MSIKMLKAPGYMDEELAQLVTDLLVLKKSQIQDFLGQNELRRSGTKAELREWIEEALRDGELAPERIVQFLDEVTPWGKQHVYLYAGPGSSIADWKKPDWVANLLKQHRVGKYLNATLPLALPEAMKLSSILHDNGRLRITAIKKREWWERDEEFDEAKRTPDGDRIELRAFVHRVTRSLVAFEWDLTANTAFLQISQLPAGFRYEEVQKEFFDLIRKWLDDAQFRLIDLRPVIKQLQEIEDASNGEFRSLGARYRTPQGGTLEGKSASPADRLLDDPVINAAMTIVRTKGIGHLGNFYWLPGAAANPTTNPLRDNVHVYIVGRHNRINFPTPNGEQAIRYVLSRIRSRGT